MRASIQITDHIFITFLIESVEIRKTQVQDRLESSAWQCEPLWCLERKNIKISYQVWGDGSVSQCLT